MAKLLIITSYVQNFHNYLDGVHEQLAAILGDQYDTIEATQDTNELTCEKMREYDCVLIFCPATWTLKGTDSFAVELTRYLITGGKVLHIHIACFGGFTEGRQLFAGAFRMHPPYQKYTFIPSEEGKKWLDGAESFSINDEAHLLYSEKLLEKEVLLYAVLQDGKSYHSGVIEHQDIYAQNSGYKIPLSWRLTYGAGKMVYVCPGHNAESFENEVLRAYLKNCSQWLLDE